MTASESLGEQKKRDPMIMLRSASPSAAAPKTGGSLVVSISRPSLLSPILATSSTACVRLGSAWPCDAEAGPPKSSFDSPAGASRRCHGRLLHGPRPSPLLVLAD